MNTVVEGLMKHSSGACCSCSLLLDTRNGEGQSKQSGLLVVLSHAIHARRCKLCTFPIPEASP